MSVGPYVPRTSAEPEPEGRSLRGLLANFRSGVNEFGAAMPRVAMELAKVGMEMNLPLQAFETIRNPERLQSNPIPTTTGMLSEIARSVVQDTAPNVAALATSAGELPQIAAARMLGVDPGVLSNQGSIGEWARERSSQALTEYYEDPVMDFFLRDVGNVAIVGSGVGAAAGGVARGATSAAARATARGAPGAAARRTTAAQTARGVSDAGYNVLGRPYRSTVRTMLDADVKGLGTLRGGLSEFAQSRTPGLMANVGATPGSLTSPYARLLERVADTNIVSNTGASRVLDRTVSNTRNMVQDMRTRLNQRYTHATQDFTPESRIQRTYHALSAAARHDDTIRAALEGVELPGAWRRSSRTFEGKTMQPMYDALLELDKRGINLPPGNRMTPELVNRTIIDLHERINGLTPGSILDQITDRVILGSMKVGSGAQAVPISDLLLDAQRALTSRQDLNIRPAITNNARVIVSSPDGKLVGEVVQAPTKVDGPVTVRLLSETREPSQPGIEVHQKRGDILEVPNDGVAVYGASLADQIEATFLRDFQASPDRLNARIAELPEEIRNAVSREVDNVRNFVAHQETLRFNELGEAFGGERIRLVDDGVGDGGRVAQPLGADEVRGVNVPRVPNPEAQRLVRQNRTVGRHAEQIRRRREFLDDRNTASKAGLVDDLRRLNRDLEQMNRQIVAETDPQMARQLLDEQRALQQQINETLQQSSVATPDDFIRAQDRLDETFSSLVEVLENPHLLREMTPEHAARLTELYTQLDDLVTVSLQEPALLMTPITLDGRQTTVLSALNQRQSGLDGLGFRIRQAQANPQYVRQMDDLVNNAHQAVKDYSSSSAVRAREIQANRTEVRARLDLAKVRSMERSLEGLSRKLDEAIEQAMWSRHSAAAPDRTYLKVAREVGPDADRLLREQGLGPLADQLRLAEMPDTLQRMVDAGVDPTYLKSMPARGVSFDNRGLRRGDVEMARTGELDVIQHQMQHETAARIMKEEIYASLERSYGKTAEQVLVDDTQRMSRQEFQQLQSQGSSGEQALAAQMHEANYATMKPDELFGLPRAKGSVSGMYVPEHINQAMRMYRDMNGVEKFLTQFWQPYATGIWRAGVLALRPMWHVNNAVGGFFLTQTAGRMNIASYLEFMPQAISEYRRIRRGLGPSDSRAGQALAQANLDDLFESSLAQQFAPRNLGRQARVTATDRVQRAELAMSSGTDDLAASIGNAFSEERRLARRAAGQRAGREGHQRSQRPAQWWRDFKSTGDAGVQASYRANSFVDNVHRSAVYLNDVLAKGKSPDEAITHAVRTMGDYAALTPAERIWMRSVYPFYSWARHMFFVGARMLKPESMQHTLTMFQLSELLGQPNAIEEMLPSYASGDIHLGSTDDGRDRFLGTSGFNVFGGAHSPFNPSGIHPILQTGIEQRSGVNWFTRRPFSSPTSDLDELGRPLPNSPALGQHLAQQFPQYKLGQGLRRWATGDWNPRYDTGEPMVFEGIQPQNPLYRDVLGQFFPPIRTMDLQDIEERVDFRQQTEEVRAQRYEQQRAEYEEGLRAFSRPG